MSETSYPPTTPAPSDGEYPQIWEHYANLVASRQRILQALMAYYVQKNDCIQELFDVEQKTGLPAFTYVPETTAGKNSLTRFNSVVESYKTVFNRYKSIYDL